MFKAPYLPYSKLRNVAESFFSEYHPSRALPVPIETIVEFRFEMDIVPIPGLHESHETDSALSNDLRTIYIDEHVFKRREKRYRFSLAHELSHTLIHSDLFRDELAFKNLAEWKAVMASIPVQEYSYIETQAYSLAGLILVPSEHLSVAYEKAEKSTAAAGISLRDVDAKGAKCICTSIGEEFLVSGDVIWRRLRYDHLCEFPE